MSTVIAVNSVTVKVRNATLLDRVSFSIMPGETVAIVGPNGAGKSTLLRVLSGDLAASAGSVQLNGRFIGDYSPDELAMQRAVLSQHVQVNFPFRVDEVVRMGGGRAPESVVAPLTAAALGEADLVSFATRELPTLSGGEQQRAHFARVLVQLACGERRGGGGLLLLDEPTSSLDMRHQLGLLDAATRRTGRRTAMIAVLHDLNLAARFARRILVLHHGRLVADGSPSSTITKPILRDIFGIDAKIDATPSGLPFVLPQNMSIAAIWQNTSPMPA